MKYLIDTNILIDHLRLGKKDSIDFFKKVESREIKAIVSVITEYELLAVKTTKKEKVTIEELLGLFMIIPVNSEIVRNAASFRLQYQLSFPDGLITASAYCFDASIITKDKTFKKVKELEVIDKLL